MFLNTKPKHECGIFGCVSSKPWPANIDVANIISLGLVALQHRGQESAGIVTCDDLNQFNIHKGMGLVNSVFNSQVLSSLQGNIGIGHTRYSTHGKSELTNCQPFVVDTMYGKISVAHNGELVNKHMLRKEILEYGIGLSTASDSEVITQLLCFPHKNLEKDGADWIARIIYLMKKTQLAYSLLLLNGNDIYAVRDPYGNRPLCVGKLVSLNYETHGSCFGNSDNDVVEGWVVSSESCAFHSMGAKYHREILPGEIVKISSEGIESLAIVPREDPNSSSALCIFEYVYFARADSIFEGQTVYTVRKRCGMELAKESGVEADIVSTVPESATPSAFGFSEVSKIPYVEVLTKNRYIGRTFIQPSNRLRKLAVSKKFGPLCENLHGKRVVLIDDSIVRGNTMGSIVKMLREGGAKEVHIRIASPPVKYPCYMGINIPTKEELIANQMDIDEIRTKIGADSLVYLSVEGLINSVKFSKQKETANGIAKLSIKHDKSDDSSHCLACLTGDYPVAIEW